VTLFLAGFVSGHYQVKINVPDKTLRIKIKSSAYNVPLSSVSGRYGPMRINHPGLDRPLLVPFKPHLTHPYNYISSTVHRYAREMPEGVADERKRFAEYSRLLIRSLWPETLKDEDVPTFVEWLDSSNYPGGRKIALKKLRDEITRIERGFGHVDSFIKDENYKEPKNARSINSPSDESKTLLGPLFRAIDKRTFGLDVISQASVNCGGKYFVKGTNPRDWPDKLRELFGSREVVCTDFTSFESHHSGVFCEVVYYWYLHMVRNLTGIRPLKDLIASLMLGRRQIDFKHISVEVDQRLMSGALWTSSANGVLNLMIMSYLSSSAKKPDASPVELVSITKGEFRGLVEGDDGICEGFTPLPGQIERLGCVLDFAVKNNFSEAGFCGILCAGEKPANGDYIIKDPVPVLQGFFVLPAKYKTATRKVCLGLLRARALSYLCNFSRCPVIASLCHWVCRMTRSIDCRKFADVLDSYKRETLETALKEKVWETRHEISEDARALMESEFDFPVEIQKAIESAFDACQQEILDFDLSMFCSEHVMRHSRDFIFHSIGEMNVPEPNPSEVILSIYRNGLKPKSLSKKAAMCLKRGKLPRDVDIIDREVSTRLSNHVAPECREGLRTGHVLAGA